MPLVLLQFDKVFDVDLYGNVIMHGIAETPGPIFKNRAHLRDRAHFRDQFYFKAARVALLSKSANYFLIDSYKRGTHQKHVLPMSAFLLYALTFPRFSGVSAI